MEILKLSTILILALQVHSSIIIGQPFLPNSYPSPQTPPPPAPTAPTDFNSHLSRTIGQLLSTYKPLQQQPNRLEGDNNLALGGSN